MMFNPMVKKVCVDQFQSCLIIFERIDFFFNFAEPLCKFWYSEFVSEITSNRMLKKSVLFELYVKLDRS